MRTPFLPLQINTRHIASSVCTYVFLFSFISGLEGALQTVGVNVDVNGNGVEKVGGPGFRRLVKNYEQDEFSYGGSHFGFLEPTIKVAAD